MNLSELQTKLITAAKQNPPDDRVPYAFEKRIMARLGSQAPANVWTLWSKPLWRAALSCLAITMLCGIWTLRPVHTARSDAENFSQDFETTVLASVNQSVEESW